MFLRDLKISEEHAWHYGLQHASMMLTYIPPCEDYFAPDSFHNARAVHIDGDAMNPKCRNSPTRAPAQAGE
jgi:hypothetical protein